MLTRKHFAAVAAILALGRLTEAARAELAKDFAGYFEGENARFNEKLFYRAVFLWDGDADEAAHLKEAYGIEV